MLGEEKKKAQKNKRLPISLHFSSVSTFKI